MLSQLLSQLSLQLVRSIHCETISNVLDLLIADFCGDEHVQCIYDMSNKQMFCTHSFILDYEGVYYSFIGLLLANLALFASLVLLMFHLRRHEKGGVSKVHVLEEKVLEDKASERHELDQEENTYKEKE